MRKVLGLLFLVSVLGVAEEAPPAPQEAPSPTSAGSAGSAVGNRLRNRQQRRDSNPTVAPHSDVEPGSPPGIATPERTQSTTPIDNGGPREGRSKEQREEDWKIMRELFDAHPEVGDFSGMFFNRKSHCDRVTYHLSADEPIRVVNFHEDFRGALTDKTTAVLVRVRRFIEQGRIEEAEAEILSLKTICEGDSDKLSSERLRTKAIAYLSNRESNVGSAIVTEKDAFRFSREGTCDEGEYEIDLIAGTVIVTTKEDARTARTVETLKRLVNTLRQDDSVMADSLLKELENNCLTDVDGGPNASVRLTESYDSAAKSSWDASLNRFHIPPGYQYRGVLLVTFNIEGKEEKFEIHAKSGRVTRKSALRRDHVGVRAVSKVLEAGAKLSLDGKTREASAEFKKLDALLNP